MPACQELSRADSFVLSVFFHLPKYIPHPWPGSLRAHVVLCSSEGATARGRLGESDFRPEVCQMISLEPFAILQRLQTLDKLLVSERGNGIQRPNEALSVFRSLSQISPKENYNQLVVAASRC